VAARGRPAKVTQTPTPEGATVNLSTPAIVAIIVAAVVLLALIALVVMLVRKRKRRREQLKERYGAEYARTVDETGSKRKAEEHLTEREQRRQQLDVRELTSGERTSFRGRFEALESSFIDSPDASVRSADALLDEVAETRGYPEATADQRLEDLAVDHPAAVDRYRRSRPSVDGSSISTEQHRQALIGSRALFEALLGRDDDVAPGAPRAFRDIVDDEDAASNGHRRDEHTRRSPA
jgi:hypothetical protein